MSAQKSINPVIQKTKRIIMAEVFQMSSTFCISYIYPCVAAGLDRVATEIETELHLECTPEGEPRVLLIPDLAAVKSLHAHLGAFIKEAEAEKLENASNLK